MIRKGIGLLVIVTAVLVIGACLIAAAVDVFFELLAL